MHVWPRPLVLPVQRIGITSASRALPNIATKISVKVNDQTISNSIKVSRQNLPPENLLEAAHIHVEHIGPCAGNKMSSTM